MRRNAILAMQHKSGVRPSVFDKTSKGPPFGFENKMSIKDYEEKEMIFNSFVFGFEDSLEVICGVISILPAEYSKEYQNRNILSD